MMILMGFSISKVVIGVLFVSLLLLLAYILYKKVLAFVGKGVPVNTDYCVLYSLEQDPVVGEMEIYFTTKEPKKVAIEILNEDMNLCELVVEKDFKEGGHIIRFDSTKLSNGTYFYGLRTENQKTVKKISIKNL
ncbi:MAG: hypothetical protein RL265_1724 [Bacteroidota bacterium]|jgi:hypothetical protein